MDAEPVSIEEGAPSPLLKKFFLSLEQLRRTDEGRVRTAEEFLAHFFPHDAEIVADQIFRHMPREVRGPILTRWGIRGAKSAVRDDDARVEETVHDALIAGDLDAASFESGIAPEVVVDHLPLADWWTFWRTGSLSAAVVQRAVVMAHEIGLYDADWFLETLGSSDGALRGIDVFAPRLSKSELSDWVRDIAANGEASSEAVIAALGWRRLVEHTATSALVAVLDALMKRVGLNVDVPASTASRQEPS